MTEAKLLMLGSTGEVGRHALFSSLSSALFGSIHALGRRAPSLPPSTPNTSLLTSTSVSFDSLLTTPPSADESAKFSAVGAGAVLICLGSTRAAAGSFEEFYKIDREYVLAGAKAARVDGKKQVLLYCSSAGSSSGSVFPYTKSKGLTEEGLALLGYDETIIFRPGMLTIPGGRAEQRRVEAAAGAVMSFISKYIYTVDIQTPILGAAMAKAAAVGVDGLRAAGIGKMELLAGKEAWVVSNADAVKFGQS